VAERIHFDARFIRTDFPDGISRFSIGLVTELAKITEVVAVIHDERQRELLPARVETLLVNPPTSWHEVLLGRRLNRAGVELLFSPMQTTGSLGRRFKLVLTLHDLIYYRHREPPGFLSAPLRVLWRLYHLAWWPQRLMLRRADAVVTVSETVAKQIREHRLAKSVSVVYNAADALPETSQNRALNRGAQSRRLVYVGSFIGYKNVATLVRALELLPEHELWLLSPVSEAQRGELESVASVGSRLRFLNGVSDAEYSSILGGAQALVTASLDEGFGIPLIEAMARGVPVVCSDLEIFREVAGPAASYCDPNRPESFAAAVDQLAEPAIWDGFSAAGLEQAKRYSWQLSAAKLLAVLRSV
jgi:glycosyltransferase involved in cell wall biosynthesis